METDLNLENLRMISADFWNLMDLDWWGDECEESQIRLDENGIPLEMKED